MKNLFLILALLLSAIGQTMAQIYADVSVSHGANPLGTFRIQLHYEKAPRTVANFIGLATGQRNWIDPSTGIVQIGKRYYDGLTFHRLDHDFMIQGGDPLGSGQGGPGYLFQDEFDPSLSHDDSYVVSMANSGANSNGSQFFITLSAPTFLDNKHSIFGTVINDATYPNSRALIDSFKNSANFPTTSEQPDTPIRITSIAISGPNLASFEIHAPSLMLPTVSNLPMAIQYDSTADSFELSWQAQRKFDYPLYYSTDLENWFLAGKLLSMDETPQFDVGINGIATADSTFYISSSIDYSAVPEAPQDMLEAGGVLDLNANGGTLTLSFDGSGGGTWTFTYSDGVTAIESGSIESSSQTDDISSYPVIPTAGTYIASSQSYARFLSLRQITAFLDSPAGPDLLTAVQPVISFHTQTTGWFDGAFNTDSTDSTKTIIFRGDFTYTAPDSID